MQRTSSPGLATWLIFLGWGASAQAQTAAPAAPIGPAHLPESQPVAQPASPQPPPSAVPADENPGADSESGEFMPGFEAGLRIGIGLPVGKAGDSPLGEGRKLGDLVAWRTPVWVDVAYRVSPGASYGLYGQIGFGATGDLCPDEGKCDWADLRLGVQGLWRLNPGGDAEPWLGLGLGIESLNFQNTQSRVDDDDLPFSVRIKENLIGPELLLQAGLGLRVDKWLQLGPYAAGSVGTYLGDSYECQLERAVVCPSGSINGSAVHAWLGVGIAGRYAP
jgi:hypothetical protein